MYFLLSPRSTVPSKHSISWVNKEKSFDLGCYSSSRGYPFFMHVSNLLICNSYERHYNHIYSGAANTFGPYM